jgi:Tol biopolymer transport system component/DNA-binding winged helix-turn-helix (wHTH) protein
MGQPAANPLTPKVVRFGLFELDLDARELRKSGVKIKLHEQPFQILAMLLERPGTLVTREELQKKLWPADTFVDFDLSLNSAVKKLRQALNDDSESPRYVETLYRRGYRFIGPMNGSASSTADPADLLHSAASNGKPEPLRTQAAHLPSISNKRFVIYGAAALLLLAAAVAVYRLTPSQPPRVLGFTQITHDGLFKTNLFSDDERLYFNELQGDHFVVNQVSAAGGETSSVPAPFANAGILGIAPNGSALVVVSFQGTGGDSKTWSLPLPSGPPRLLNDFHPTSVAWSPDGNLAVFSDGGQIFVTKSDLSEPRKLATPGSHITNLRFSPDGRQLRFTLADVGNSSKAEAGNSSNSIWEMSRDGSGLRPLLPGWTAVPQECCGSWTPDGKYFVFQSFRDGRSSVWALAEKSSWFSGSPKPVQLTNGPLDFEFPVVSKDGKRIFAVGSQPRCELVHFDGKSGFEPYLNGSSIRDLSFSPDGKWIAYVTVPEDQLWRSRVDGRERLQLTPDGMHGGLPRWSPDGKQIVFMGTDFKTDWRAYLISSDGTGLRELMPGAKSGYDPGWSPDGKSVVLTLAAGGVGDPHPEGAVISAGIVIYDLERKKVSALPDSKQLFSARWSPDGRYIAAITNDSLKLMLFDLSSRQWQELANMTIGYPSWSHDGQYIYFDTTLSEDAAFFRIRISDHKLERLFSLKGLRRYWGQFGPWTGLAPDDSPLLVRDISSQEIYALDWQAP